MGRSRGHRKCAASAGQHIQTCAHNISPNIRIGSVSASLYSSRVYGDRPVFSAHLLPTKGRDEGNISPVLETSGECRKC